MSPVLEAGQASRSMQPASQRHRRPDHEALVAAVAVEEVVSGAGDTHAQLMPGGELHQRLHLAGIRRPSDECGLQEVQWVVSGGQQAVLRVEAVDETLA